MQRAPTSDVPGEITSEYQINVTNMEQKWELFARVIRSEIMAPAFNFKLFEMSQ